MCGEIQRFFLRRAFRLVCSGKPGHPGFINVVVTKCWKQREDVKVASEKERGLGECIHLERVCAMPDSDMCNQIYVSVRSRNIYMESLWAVVRGWYIDILVRVFLCSEFCVWLFLHLQHRRKYELHGGGRGLGDAEYVEVPHEARRDFAAPSPRGSRPGDEHRVRDLLPE